MAKKNISNKIEILKHSTILAVYLLIVWGFYRYLFRLPDEIEEFIIKPILWLVPVLYFVKKEGSGLSSLGIATKNLFKSIYLALFFGLIFAFEALLINYLKYGSFNFAANIGNKPLLFSLAISFMTAFSEETTFRGYLFSRVWSSLDNEWIANLSTSIVWALIHLPITIFVWKLSFASSMVYLMLTTIFGIASALIFARTKNITSSILLHVLWEWPIILFR